MNKKADIQLFNQSSEAIGGIHIFNLPINDLDLIIDKRGVHRDDYYVFFILTKGTTTMLCDAVNVEAKATSVGLVKPFQVHSGVAISDDAAGYFITAAPFLVPDSCKDIFENLKISEQVKEIEDDIKSDFLDLVSLLHNAFNKRPANSTRIIHSLFNALVYTISNKFLSSEKPVSVSGNQSVLIVGHFKKLMKENSFLEGPSFFARKLNISTSHLNDCVNVVTGKSVTYWLQNTMIMEAQRLLYYTDYDVKEVAYRLGFEDHAYFSRLFKKVTSETPLAFRKKFRE